LWVERHCGWNEAAGLEDDVWIVPGDRDVEDIPD
jgi:hypothetical protein